MGSPIKGPSQDNCDQPANDFSLKASKLYRINPSSLNLILHSVKIKSQRQNSQLAITSIPLSIPYSDFCLVSVLSYFFTYLFWDQNFKPVSSTHSNNTIWDFNPKKMHKKHARTSQPSEIELQLCCICTSSPNPICVALCVALCKTHLMISMKDEKCECSNKQTEGRVRSHWSHPTDTTLLSVLKKHKLSSCGSSEDRVATQRCIC